MISQLEQISIDKGIILKQYLFKKINSLDIGEEFYLRELLTDVKNINMQELGREFYGLIQSGEWNGLELISSNPNKYKKYANLTVENLFIFGDRLINFN